MDSNLASRPVAPGSILDVHKFDGAKIYRQLGEGTIVDRTHPSSIS